MEREGRARENVVFMYCCLFSIDPSLVDGIIDGGMGKERDGMVRGGRLRDIESYLPNQFLDFTSQCIFFAFGCCGGRECAVELGLGGCADVAEEVG